MRGREAKPLVKKALGDGGRWNSRNRQIAKYEGG